METLEQEHQQSRTTTDDRLAKKAKISVPIEIIEEILSRLPVESIIRFRSVSKPWLSRISHQGRIYSQERGSQEPVQFIIYNAKLNRKA
ncbi:putative F-box domain-containing protein [Helianthus annuus]|nr:putative F-box domain-containing protein [Helianthus annuus]